MFTTQRRRPSNPSARRLKARTSSARLSAPGSPRMLPRIIFLICLLISASGYVSPPVALATGLVFGLVFPHPYDREARKFSTLLLQPSAMGLPFVLNLHPLL